MAIKTPCQTPGAIFHTDIKGKKIILTIDLPHDPQLSLKQARLLEANLHNVVELVLSPFFRKNP